MLHSQKAHLDKAPLCDPRPGGMGALGDPVVTTALPPGLAFRGRAFRQALALL